MLVWCGCVGWLVRPYAAVTGHARAPAHVLQLQLPLCAARIPTSHPTSHRSITSEPNRSLTPQRGRRRASSPCATLTVTVSSGLELLLRWPGAQWRAHLVVKHREEVLREPLLGRLVVRGHHASGHRPTSSQPQVAPNSGTLTARPFPARIGRLTFPSVRFRESKDTGFDSFACIEMPFQLQRF